MTAAAVSNAQVGKAIGMSHSGVSRIRSGDRLPSVERMVKIAQVYAWPVDDQVKARTDGRYASAFETILSIKYGAQPSDFPVPPAA